MLKKIYYILYLFFFLFAPPFIDSINMSIILGCYSLIILIIKYPKKTVSIIKTKEFMNVLVLLYIYFTIYFCSYSISSFVYSMDITQNFFLNMYSLLLNFIVTFICSIYVVIKAKENKYDTNDIIRFFIVAAMIQLGISLFSLVSPTFRSWTISKMVKENNWKFFNSPWLLERRFYGFSNNLLDLFGFGMGLLSTVSLFLSENNKKYLIISLLLLIPCALNSRTGLIIFALGAFIFILYKLKCRRLKPHAIIFTMSIILGSLLLSYSLISKFSPNTVEWVKNDITSFISNDNHVGTATAIYDKDFWTIPNDLGLIFGKGVSVSAYSDSKVDNITHSDCGYINEIWKVGILGLIIYLLIPIYILMRCYKNESEKNIKWFYIFCIFSCFTFMIKGGLSGYNPGNVLIYTLFIQYIYIKVCNTKGEN